MEMERVTEFPLTHMERRPRKRSRLGWDVNQLPPQVFEKLGPSLYDFLQKTIIAHFPLIFILEWYQLLSSFSLVAYILLVLISAVMHDLHLIHTDLKPENILLVSPEYVKVPDYKSTSRSPKSYYRRLPKSSAIKVIDFGSTTYERQDQTYIMSTRHYCAPEVILGLGWSYPCDIWSVGCILVELCTGEVLFQTHENLVHLAMMERLLGPLPQHMLKRVEYKLIMQHVDHSAGDLIHLLQGLLSYDPIDRLTAGQALRHPFLSRDQLRR
ncbi:hypothetical protein CRYUN_Cryun13aG0022600 [Craigia yunnanensis]